MIWEIAGGIIIAALVLGFFKKIRLHFAKKSALKATAKAEYNSALKEKQLIDAFVNDEERVKRWKVVQFKCQFFSRSYNGDKNSGIPEIADKADAEFEKILSSQLETAFAVQDDECCKCAMLDSIVECMAEVGQFERADKLLKYITVETIKNTALEKLNARKSRAVNYPPELMNPL